MPAHSAAQLGELCRGLEAMLGSGMTVRQTLTGLAERTKDEKLSSALARASGDVEEGSTLTEALQQTGRFGPTFTGLVRVGEQTGRLDVVVGELAEFYETRQRMWARFRDSMWPFLVRYGLAVLILCVAPSVMTPFLLGGTGLLRNLAVGFGIPVLLGVGVWYAWRHWLAGRYLRAVVSKVPGAGRAARAVTLTRFSLAMRLLLEADSSVPAALDLALEASDDPTLRSRRVHLLRLLDGGESLSGALRASGLFPPELLRVVEAGEESGDLEGRFGWLADHYWDEYRRGVEQLVESLALLSKGVALALVFGYIYLMIQSLAAAL